MKRGAGRWLFFLLPLAFYLSTVSREIGLPDTAIIIDEMRAPVLSSHVNSHNANNLIGYVFNQLPIANIALKSNLASVLYGTAAVGLFFWTLLALRLPAGLAALGASVLMVSHSLWWHSTQVENYALSAAFLCACLYFVARDVAEPGPARYLLLLCFTAGMSMFNHLQNGALCLAAGLYVLVAVRRFKADSVAVFFQCVAAGLAGLLPQVAVWGWDFFRPETVAGTAAWAVGGDFRQLMFHYRPGHAVAQFARWLFLQFPSPFLALIPLGCAVLCRRGRLAVFPVAVFAITTGFFMGYETWDQFAFYLPSFICLALAGCLGAAWCVERAPPALRWAIPAGLAASVVLPLLIYPGIPRWAAAGDGYWQRRFGAVQTAYRTRYDLVGLYADPWHRDRGTVTAFIHDLFDALPPQAQVVDDMSISYQARYFQTHYGLRPDVRFHLIRPPGMAGWGEAPADLALTCVLTTNRVFIVATNGPCHEVVDALQPLGRAVHPVPLHSGRIVYEVVPASP